MKPEQLCSAGELKKAVLSWSLVSYKCQVGVVIYYQNEDK